MAETPIVYPDWSRCIYEFAPTVDEQRDFFRSFGIELDEKDLEIYDEVRRKGREKYGIPDGD